MSKAGKEMAFYAVRMGYDWHMACFEKDHLHYFARTVQCNQMLYFFLQALRFFLHIAFGMRTNKEQWLKMHSKLILPCITLLRRKRGRFFDGIPVPMMRKLRR